MELVFAVLMSVSVSAAFAYAVSAPGLWVLHKRGQLRERSIWMPLAVVCVWWLLYIIPSAAGSQRTQFWNILELALVLITLGIHCIACAWLGRRAQSSDITWSIYFWTVPIAAVVGMRSLMPPIYE
jgi:hypothetical protein